MKFSIYPLSDLRLRLRTFATNMFIGAFLASFVHAAEPSDAIPTHWQLATPSAGAPPRIPSSSFSDNDIWRVQGLENSVFWDVASNPAEKALRAGKPNAKCASCHVESAKFAGRGVAVSLEYGTHGFTDSACISLRRDLSWPFLARGGIVPSASYGKEVLPKISVDGVVARHERVNQFVRAPGLLIVRSTVGARHEIGLERVIFPSSRLPIYFEVYRFRNNTNPGRPVKFSATGVRKGRVFVDAKKGGEGGASARPINTIAVFGDVPEIVIEPGQEVTTALLVAADPADGKPPFPNFPDVMAGNVTYGSHGALGGKSASSRAPEAFAVGPLCVAEFLQRQREVLLSNAACVLETPDPVLDAAFAFAKWRAVEGELGQGAGDPAVAAFSQKLWALEPGAENAAGKGGEETPRGAATFEALCGQFAEGEASEALSKLQACSRQFLLGGSPRASGGTDPGAGINRPETPEENLRYCRVFTSGLFGIRPAGRRAFDCAPRLPEGWRSMSLRNVTAFGETFDITVSHADEPGKLLVQIKRSGAGKTPAEPELHDIAVGESVRVDFDAKAG
ncbi:MAG: hypothetical protein LBG65_05995 [Puniceicoccales bacterium]|jgi:hypothetical protein|nr:hypothetical protein [Puniceicoccales bacterium]